MSIDGDGESSPNSNGKRATTEETPKDSPKASTAAVGFSNCEGPDAMASDAGTPRLSARSAREASPRVRVASISAAVAYWIGRCRCIVGLVIVLIDVGAWTVVAVVCDGANGV